ncbi:MAG: hypothetical protein GXY83_40990 [Rhodopirellula sp.]|mgnify:CR=1 FL=1|nr:hypothetical protein [Rhodopirellula sp.]
MEQPPPLPTNPVVAGAGFWIRALARIIDMGFGLLLGLFGGIVGAIVLVILQTVGSISPGWQQRNIGEGEA